MNLIRATMSLGGKREGAGRKKGFPALEAEKARLMIAEKLATTFAPIVDKAIEQAKAGQKDARDWLTDRAYGKSMQPIVGKDGKDLIPQAETIEKTKQVISAFLNERPETNTQNTER